jgi:hypothetical protein
LDKEALMAKIDYKKELRHFYQASVKEVGIVDVPQMNFLMIDGEGNPNTSKPFQEAVEVLYSLAYSLKFMVKKGTKGIDYGVMPLEGLWWVDDMTQFSIEKKDEWKWTLMIMQPELITRELFAEAVKEVRKKKNPVALTNIRFESFSEGKAAQIMYIGPFAEEGPTIEKVHSFITENGYTLSGKHHEIYISDMRKTAPEKLKTIIRQPMEKQG